MSNSTIIKKLFFIGLKFKKWFIITLLISLAVAFISTYRPILTKEMVDLVIIKEKSRADERDLSAIRAGSFGNFSAGDALLSF